MGGETKPGEDGLRRAPGPRTLGAWELGDAASYSLTAVERMQCLGPRVGREGRKQSQVPRGVMLPSLNDPGGLGREHLGSSMETQFGPLGRLAV